MPAMLTINSTGADITNEIVDGLDSARQRIEQHMLYWLRTWFLNARGGVPYETILKHNISDEVFRRIITDAILEVEDADSVEDVIITRNRQERSISFQARVITPFGEVRIEPEMDAPVDYVYHQVHHNEDFAKEEFS